MVGDANTHGDDVAATAAAGVPAEEPEPRAATALDRAIGIAREPAAIVLVGALGGVLLRRLHDRWAMLGISDYETWLIGDGLLSGTPALILLIQIGFVALLLQRTWHDYTFGGAARWVVGTAVATLAIGFTVYERNEFVDRLHLLDRLILLGLAVGVVWRVALLPAFTLYCFTVVAQFRWPLLVYSWTDKLVIFEVLLAFQVALAWQEVVRAVRRDARPALTAAMAVLGAWYLSAGVDKVRLGWIGRTDLSNLIKSAYVEGWLRSLPVSFVDGVAAVVGFLNPLLLVGTLLIEVVFVFFLFTTTRLRTVALASFALLHLTIFALTGIFFWKWIAVDVALALVLLRDRFDLDVRTGVAAAAAMVLLHTQVPTNLAWVDSPVTHVFSVVAVEPSGREFVVPERYFQPFELIVTQDRFGYLTEEPLIANAYGTLERSIDSDLLDGLTAENLTEFRGEHGVVRFSEVRSLIFDGFIRVQCHTWTGRRWLDGWPLLPPPHIWTTDPSNDGPPPERVDHVLVRLDTWWVDDLGAGPVESMLVRRIEIDDGCVD